MSLATSVSLFFVLGLTALLVGIVFWRLAPNRGRTSASVALRPVTRSRSRAELAVARRGAKNLLPIEKKDRPLIAASEILCVRADGRNTYLFDGRDDFFCPLSISEVEARLPRQFFFRCHRSYIVNLAHVRCVKEVADAGVVELDPPLRRAAPISHGRVAALREELAAFRSGVMPPLRADLTNKADAARAP
jgi:DNA-binding LytR/AlgR family response regulator